MLHGKLLILRKARISALNPGPQEWPESASNSGVRRSSAVSPAEPLEHTVFPVTLAHTCIGKLLFPADLLRAVQHAGVVTVAVRWSSPTQFLRWRSVLSSVAFAEALAATNFLTLLLCRSPGARSKDGKTLHCTFEDGLRSDQTLPDQHGT